MHTFCDVDQKYQSASFAQTRAAARGRWVRPSSPEDGPAIVELMKQAGLEPHEDPAHLHWKYWRARPDWSGSRSFVLTDGRDLLAHVAVVPGTLRTDGVAARLVHPIDWAARRDAVGAGVRVMRHLLGMTDYMLAVGGSSHTLKMLPLMGYLPRGTVTGYVRTLSPLRILQRPSGARWKVAPRMARSLLWSLSAPGAVATGWQARRIGADELGRLAHALPESRPGMALFGRSADLLRHVLACPIVPVELYALEKAGRMLGVFILSYPPGQARLADLWVHSADPADWRALVEMAVRQAKQRGGLAELVAWSSDPKLSQVFETCGFHARLTLPIYLRSSRDFPVPEETLRVQMIDNDAFYLYFGRNELWA